MTQAATAPAAAELTAARAALAAAQTEAAMWREAHNDLLDVIPQLADADDWPLDVRCAAHDVLRRSLALRDAWHAERVTVPTQRQPIELPA